MAANYQAKFDKALQMKVEKLRGYTV
jgi:hypothetical protein